MRIDTTYANLNALITALSPTAIVYALDQNGGPRVKIVGLIMASAEQVVALTDVDEVTFTGDHAAAVKVAHIDGSATGLFQNSAVPGYLNPTLYKGAGAPGVATLVAGAYKEGDLYFDTTNEVWYGCSDAGTEATSVWDKVAYFADITAANASAVPLTQLNDSIASAKVPMVYSGNYAGAAPTNAVLATGTYNLGDLAVDTSAAKVWVCTTAGAVVHGVSDAETWTELKNA